jgi:hypothetical protein
MTVAKIAYDSLDKGTKDRMNEFLIKHPHYGTYLTKNKPDGVDLKEWVFLRAATWPDWVRPPKAPSERNPDVVKYHRPNDHFTNLPVFPKDVTPDFAARIRRQLRPHDVVCALKQRVEELRLETVPPADKAVALCWMLHLIGDIHQPLHCAALFSPELFPHGDMGGNSVAVRIDGEKKRLHTYWDELLGVADDEIPDTPRYAEEAYRLVIRNADALVKAYPAGSLGDLKSKDFRAWAAESLALAEEVGYWGGEIAKIAVVAPRYPGELPEDARPVPDGYSKKAADVARRQAALAGQRLNDFLRLAFKE